jgi:hypothetical protein
MRQLIRSCIRLLSTAGVSYLYGLSHCPTLINPAHQPAEARRDFFVSGHRHAGSQDKLIAPMLLWV